MKICFFGVGGVGGYFGTLVTKKFKGEHDIYFIARGSHKNAICSKGLTLKKAGGEEIIIVSPELCTDTVDNLPVCDIIILAVKAYDLTNAAKEISKIADEKTLVLPLLNGVDIYERIREHLHTGVVLQSCVYVGTHIESPGVIYQKGGSCTIYAGNDPMFPDLYPESLLTLLKDSEIDINWEDNIKISIWSKYMFIAAFGLVTATYEKTLGEIMEDPELGKMTKSIMNEIEEIAKRLNIPLSSDIVDTSFLKAKQFPYETKTSFQRDVESKGKINEGDLFGGTLIRYGEALKISTPDTKNVYERLLRKFK
jgi:2-dehydropantoate 2-reductase